MTVCGVEGSTDLWVGLPPCISVAPPNWKCSGPCTNVFIIPTMGLGFLVTGHIRKSYSGPILNQLITLNSVWLEEAYFE